MILQATFDAIPKVAVLFAGAPIVNAFEETVNVADPASCVTVIVCDVTPTPDTTNVAVRVVDPVLDAAVKVIISLFEPELLLNDNHKGSELDILHDTFDEIATLVVLFAGAPIVNAFEETVNVADPASCVTVIVCDVTPTPDTTNVAVRVVEPGLAAAVKVIVPLFEPELLLNDNHVG